MKHKLTDYKTLVLDCDGVVLNSNQTKINAYYNASKAMGGTDAQAQAFVDYHIQLGSIPRNDKIKYYLTEIDPQPMTDALFQKFMDTFTVILEETLINTEIAPGLHALKAATPNSKWMLMSGGDQSELRQLFPKRNLADLFEKGIYGGPTKKKDHLAVLKANGSIQMPALFLGDSKYDHQAATEAGLDFVYLSDWTDVADWQVYCAECNIDVRPNMLALLTVE